MYTTAKKLATVSAVACSFAITGLALLILCSNSLGLTFTMAFAVFSLSIGGSACILFHTLTLRSICQDLECEYENNVIKIKELNDRINALEKDENNQNI